MLVVVLIPALFLMVHCDTECFFDIVRLRCWCRDENNITLFRITHQKNRNKKWSVEYDVTNKECDPLDILHLLPPKWTGQEEDITDTYSTTGSDPISGAGNEPEQITKRGYQQIGSSLYKLYTFGTYWDDARRTCIKDGAHLAIINSDTEADNLGLLLKNSRTSIQQVASSESAFIGIHDMFEEGEFVTIFGQPIKETGYHIWSSKKQHHRAGIQLGLPGNDCGGLYSTGTLVALGCDWFHAYICEIDFSSPMQTHKVDYSRGAFRGIEVTKRRPGTKKPGFGYKHYSGLNFYRYHTTAMIWDNARIACEREGAYLAIVNSKEELDILNAIINRVPREFIVAGYETRNTFLGFHCLFERRTFVTLFNETLDSEILKLAKFNNLWANSKYVGENCGAIDSEGVIGDIDCNMHNAFMCEKDAL